MATEKITITPKLRLNIIERRKNKGISSYDLSLQVGNGRSKFWLQNIESGKTKKISKDDLIKIYMILEDTEDPEDVIYDIEQIIKQNIGNTERKWYELIDIADEFSEIYQEDDLMEIVDELLTDQIYEQIRNSIFEMSTNQKQAALSALQHLYYSLYKNPDLAFALISIPAYGIDGSVKSEYTTALNDLLSLYEKFNDIAQKNNSLNVIRNYQEYDKYMDSLFKEWIHTALDNFKKIISELYNEIRQKNPDIFSLMRTFNTDVSFMIERGQPNVLKHYLKSWRIDTGKDFSTHIKDCVNWFTGFMDDYDLPAIFDVVDKHKLESIYKFLDNYGEINPHK